MYHVVRYSRKGRLIDITLELIYLLLNSKAGSISTAD